MIDQIIQYKQLRKIFGGTTAAELAAKLTNQNIPFRLGKRNLPITTFSALNHSMGISLHEDLDSSHPKKNRIEI